MTLLIAVVIPAWPCAPVGADGFNLEDKASSAFVNAPGITGATGFPYEGPSGNTSLRRNDPEDRPPDRPRKDYIEDMERQWYWLGVDGDAARPIEDFGTSAGTGLLAHEDLDLDGDLDRLQFQYFDDNTLIRVQYRLIGSAYPHPHNIRSGFANTMLRTIGVINFDDVKHAYGLYTMTDLALTGIVDTVTGEITHDPTLGERIATGPAVVPIVHERIVQSDWHPAAGEISNAVTTYLSSPGAPHYMLVSDDSLVPFIEAGGTLTDNPSVLDPKIPNTGEDMQFALQWDFKLDPGGSFVITESLMIIPEPTTLSMLLILTATRRRRRPRR
ncbi:MAG: hypothetical protein CMJ18_03660 [Phycisphaeraceae bacterium]|nr:hypothetical protein [Phycisphaeraceae bacterium]